MSKLDEPYSNPRSTVHSIADSWYTDMLHDMYTIQKEEM